MPDLNTEERKDKPDNKVMEKRQSIGLRTIADDQGIVQAYLTKWGTVDTYGTTFIPGSFKKTFAERGTKIRVLYDHKDLAGKMLDMGEDSIGPWVKVQFNLETRTGLDTFAHIKAGDIDCFSFGFNTLQSRRAGDIIEITEIRVLEVCPVIFEANPNAEITVIRSDKKEDRAETFTETLDRKLLATKGYEMICALEWTLDDIKWGDNSTEDIVSKTDTAIGEFHLAYVQWLSDYFATFERSEEETAVKELRKIKREGKNAIKNALSTLDKDLLIRSTSITEKEMGLLKNGNLLSIESRNKLAELPEEIQKSHQLRRREVVSTLCDELRSSGFSSLERLRFLTLLGISEKREDNSMNEDVNVLISAISKWNL